MAEPPRPSCREERGAEIAEANGGGDLAEIAAMYDDMVDDVDDIDPAKLQIEEGMVAEVMRRLEEEINRPCASGGGGGGCEVAEWLGGDHRQCQLVELVLPSSTSSSSFFSAPAFVTVKGNEESCGPSFSHSASTVMASIDTCGVPRRPIGDEREDSVWPWPWRFPEPATVVDPAAASGVGGGGCGSGAGEGFAVEDADDEWMALARVLNSAGWFDPDAGRCKP